jgi:ABC-2 type transport system permease protein
MIYIPTAIYAGSFTGAAAIAAILVQLTWTVALLGAGRLLFRTAHRRLVVQGG